MYQVLYRKWRPRAFSDVYGQPHVTDALRNEMRTGRLAHAYLFTGSRGTGKTSCAKILAKAVNCLNPQDGEPCNACDVCRGIDEGTILDVVEIDAASNNGVDNIRDLREEVNFTPAVAKYRVYIIDEVHMLSIGAFNALLKTLEEPPAHVIFILATTEVHKLPATILSRCQRFDFARIKPEDIAARIAYIAGQEGFTVTEEAALLVARLADGGMRDALSLLDQCISRTREVTVDTVAEAAGMAGRDYLFELSAAVRSGDAAACLGCVDRLYNASRDMERLCGELIDYFRNLMILKSVGDAQGLVVAPPADLAQMRAEADQLDLTMILHCMDTLERTYERLRAGGSRRVEMEMTLLRLCSPSLDSSAESLLRRVKALEDRLNGGMVPSEPATSAAAVPAPPPAAQPRPAKPAAEPAPPIAEAPTATEEVPLPADPPPAPDAAPSAGAEAGGAEVPFDRWGDVLETLAGTCPPLYGVLAGSSASLRGDTVVIYTDNELFRALVGRDGNKALLAGAIRGVTGRACRIGVRKPGAQKPKGAEDAAPADPLSAFLRKGQALGADIQIKD